MTKIRFEAESKMCGKDTFYKEVATEAEFEQEIEAQRTHYKELAKYDRTLTVTACVVEDNQVIYFDQLV